MFSAPTWQTIPAGQDEPLELPGGMRVSLCSMYRSKDARRLCEEVFNYAPGWLEG